MKKIITIFLAAIFTFSCSENFNFQNPFQTIEDENLEIKEEIEISQEFVQGSEDIPLISGMTKSEDSSIGFDSSSGSIISSSYESTKNKKAIAEFYLNSLPQLGWQIINKNENKISFKRDNEELEIEFTSEQQKEIITFFISSNL